MPLNYFSLRGYLGPAVKPGMMLGLRAPTGPGEDLGLNGVTTTNLAWLGMGLGLDGIVWVRRHGWTAEARAISIGLSV